MMPTTADDIVTKKSSIDREKKTAVQILDDKIYQALEKKNGSNDAKMASVIHDLMDERTDIYVQAYAGSLNSDDMDKALAAMKVATADMTRVAKEMKEVTDIIGKAGDRLAAGGKVVSTLRGVIS
jgi:hypothetical protein